MGKHQQLMEKLIILSKRFNKHLTHSILFNPSSFLHLYTLFSIVSQATTIIKQLIYKYILHFFLDYAKGDPSFPIHPRCAF